MKRVKPKYLLVSVILAGLLLRLFILLRPFVYIDNLFIPDDTYLSLKIAQNLAQGKGMTFDGINATNGFQPLLVLLMIPVYALIPHDLILPIRIDLLLLSLSDAITALLLYTLVLFLTGDALAGIVAAFLWSFSPTIISNTLCGLETALNVCLLSLATYLYLQKVRGHLNPPSRQCFLLGIILGLSVLARIDSVFLGITMMGDILLYSIRNCNRAKVKSLIKNSCWIGGGGLLVLLPWWILELTWVGTLIPESSESVHLQAFLHTSVSLTHRFLLSLFHLSNAPVPFFIPWKLKVVERLDVINYGLLLAIFFGALILVFTLLRMMEKVLKRERGVLSLSFLILFGLILLFFYNFYFSAFWFFKRYFHPLFLISTLIAGLFVSAFGELSERVLAGKGRVSFLITFILFGLYFFCPPLKFYLLGRPESTVDKGVFGVKGYYGVLKELRTEEFRGKRIGSFQSGALGYFLEGAQVFNLDGVVNGAALEAVKQGRLPEYIDSLGIEYVIDWDWNIQNYLPLESKGQEINPRLEYQYSLKPQDEDSNTTFRVFRWGKGEKEQS